MAVKPNKDESEWDFKWGNDASNLTLEAIPTDLGITYIEDLSETNVLRVQLWAKAQLESVLSDRYSQVKMKNREAEQNTSIDGQAVFGVPLAVLIERDRKQFPDPTRDSHVPLVLEAMLVYFTLKGGMSMGPSVLVEEPVASLPDGPPTKDGHRPPKLTERNVIMTLDRYFHKAVKYSHTALSMAKIHDIVYAIKHFIVCLPEPLLTNQFIDVFLQLHNVKDSMDLLIIMKLLVLQMPKSHRCTLWCLLTFFAQLSARDEKDTLTVVREVMSPYLLPVSEAARSEMPAEVIEPMQRRLTLLMHKYRTILFAVPVDVVKALRTYDRKSAVDVSNVAITVNSPQLGIQNYKISQDPKKIRVMELVEIAIASVNDKHCPPEFQGRLSKCTSREENRKLFAQLTCQWKNLPADKCNMISTDQEFFSDCHRLYEVGGNIDERRISHLASTLAVYQENPDVKWEIRCDHPLCMSEFSRHIPNYEQICDQNVINQLTSLCRSPTFDSQA